MILLKIYIYNVNISHFTMTQHLFSLKQVLNNLHGMNLLLQKDISRAAPNLAFSR